MATTDIRHIDCVPFETIFEDGTVAYMVKLIAIMDSGFPGAKNPVTVPVVWTQKDIETGGPKVVQDLFENSVQALNDCIHTYWDEYITEKVKREMARAAESKQAS